MNKIIECVPNFSEGRNQDIIDEISNSISNTKGVHLLNINPVVKLSETWLDGINNPDDITIVVCKKKV